MLLNFSDRTGTGVFSMVWSLPKDCRLAGGVNRMTASARCTARPDRPERGSAHRTPGITIAVDYYAFNGMAIAPAFGSFVTCFMYMFVCIPRWGKIQKKQKKQTRPCITTYRCVKTSLARKAWWSEAGNSFAHNAALAASTFVITRSRKVLY